MGTSVRKYFFLINQIWKFIYKEMSSYLRSNSSFGREFRFGISSRFIAGCMCCKLCLCASVAK